MVNYKKKYLKYKLKYLNLKNKQKAGSLSISYNIEKMISDGIDYINNLLFLPNNQPDEDEDEDEDEVRQDALRVAIERMERYRNNRDLEVDNLRINQELDDYIENSSTETNTDDEEEIERYLEVLQKNKDRKTRKNIEGDG